LLHATGEVTTWKVLRGALLRSVPGQKEAIRAFVQIIMYSTSRRRLAGGPPTYYNLDVVDDR